MNNRIFYFFAAFSITVIVVVLLVMGSSILNMNLNKQNSIPLGTFITWAGMISLPLSVYWGINKLRIPQTSFERLLSIGIKVIILLGILWVPISYLLAGNLSFSFSERETFQGGQSAMRWFWRLSYGIGLGTIVILFIYWISLLFKKGKK